MVGIVSGLWMMHKLQDLLYQSPYLVEAALKICRGRPRKVSAYDKESLRVEHVLEKNGTMDEIWRDGILSACIVADGKVMVVNPFKG